MHSLISLLFGLKRPVDRLTYLSAGLALTALKLGVDLGVLYLATGRLWRPWELLSLAGLTAEAPIWAVRVLAVWALPFAWIGLSMSVRRAIDAGFSPWSGLFVCVPLVNLVAMVVLCFPSSRPWTLTPESEDRRDSGLKAVGAAMLVALAMALVGILGLHDLGNVLFAGTPFGMGVVAGFTYNRADERTIGGTVLVAMASVIVAAAMLLLFAVEGAVCLAMALPLALVVAIAGALLGRGVALGPRPATSPLVLLLVALPLLAWTEPALRKERTQEVTSRIEIAAPPAAVWPHVIEFPPLPPPHEVWFRVGIAYPTGARIEGRGIGAIRRCEFSTGAFVEPITTWDEPRRLAFDVVRQTQPLRELSPYPRVRIDHLKGSFATRRGDFRLRPDGRGGTILEGTTWYELSLYPSWYWSLWTDAAIRAIHLRVLRHIRSESELAAGLADQGA